MREHQPQRTDNSATIRAASTPAKSASPLPQTQKDYNANNPHSLLIIELEMTINKRNYDINALNVRCEYLRSHYLAVVAECAALYKMHGLPYAVAKLDADTTHRLPEAVVKDIRNALKVTA